MLVVCTGISCSRDHEPQCFIHTIEGFLVFGFNYGTFCDIAGFGFMVIRKSLGESELSISVACKSRETG